MTTNTITIEFEPRSGLPALSARWAIAPMPRVRVAFAGAGEVVLADEKHKSTRVSVPGCRGVT